MTRDDRIVSKGGFNYVRIKGGRLLTFWNTYDDAKRAYTSLTRGVSRAYRLAESDHDDGYDLERLAWFLEEVQTYCAHVLGLIEERRGVRTEQERIALLRNVDGRTPEEADAFRRKADELEARLRERAA